jgi:hypothetical protein
MHARQLREPAAGREVRQRLDDARGPRQVLLPIRRQRRRQRRPGVHRPGAARAAGGPCLPTGGRLEKHADSAQVTGPDQR